MDFYSTMWRRRAKIVDNLKSGRKLLEYSKNRKYSDNEQMEQQIHEKYCK